MRYLSGIIYRSMDLEFRREIFMKEINYCIIVILGYVLVINILFFSLEFVVL